MKRSLVILLTAVSISAMTAGTAFPAFAEATEAEAEETTDGAENAADSELEDGVYGVEFDTDSSMFHVNEACNGRATLTVKDGKMTVHITLVSKNIENVFLGTAEDAQKDGAELIQPTIDKVTYSDGMTEEVYGFNVPVEKLDEEFDLAIIGKKGKWYDHKVSVTDVQGHHMSQNGSCDVPFYIYFVLPSPAKYSFVSFTTVPESRNKAIRLGIAIRPLNVSAMLHISPRLAVAPRMATRE